MPDFKVTYEVDDGYVGGSRPKRFHIHASDIETEADEKDLSALFWDAIQEHFIEHVHPYSKQEAEFIKWAQEVQIKNRQEEEENA